MRSELEFSERPAGDRLLALRADCGNCAGLCCVALAFTRSGGFAFDKAAGAACSNLRQDYRCGIHPVLRERGFPGCTVFDCLGAGQKVTQVTSAGRSWRERDPASKELVFAAFQVMRPLHELLWYLHDALSRPQAQSMEGELDLAYRDLDAATRGSADDLLATDVAAQRERVAALLAAASRLVRADAQRGRSPSRVRGLRPGADLVGAALAGADLRGVDLRGARLIAADLRGADLRETDLLGADLRDADLGGADLSRALFLTPFQLSSANGSAQTAVPVWATRPAHWR